MADVIPAFNVQNQGSFLATATFQELTDITTRHFIRVGGLIVPAARQLFLTEAPGGSQGEYYVAQEYDIDTYASAKYQGVDASKAKFGIGYFKSIKATRIGKEAEITFEMRYYNKKTEVMTAITSLPNYCPQRVELDLTHRFTFCTSSSYVNRDGDTVDITTGTGNPLAYATNPLKFSSATYSSRLSGDPLFSKGALELAQTMMTTEIMNNFGEKRVMQFNTIVTGPNATVVNAVRQFLHSTSDNTQNNAGVVNTHQNEYRHVILQNLATTAFGAPDSTKKNWWFVVASNVGMEGWQGYIVDFEGVNLIPSTTGNGQDVHKDIWYFNVRESYGVGVVTPRGFLAACPTS